MELTEQEIQEIAQGSGFATQKTRPNWPTLKFNGVTGEFNMFTQVNNNGVRSFDNVKVEAPLGLIVLKERRTLVAFEQVGPKRTKTRYYTTEFSDWNSKIDLYVQRGDEKSEKIATGTPETLRKDYQILKTKKILYVINGDEIQKFPIKGSNLKVYSAWIKSLKDEGKMPFQVTAVITSEDKVAESGMKYKGLVFNTGESPKEMKFVLDKAREVNIVIAEADQKQSHNSAIEAEMSIHKDELPVIQVDSDMLKPEDIEF